MINKVTLIGNVGQDPEIRTSGSGEWARLSLATSSSWKDKKTGDWQEKTEWHRIVAFGYPGSYVSQHVKKGDQIYVEGSITYGEYTDNKGVKRYSTDIKAEKIKILGKKPKGGGEERRESSDTNFRYGGDPGYGGTGEDVPF